nr:phosphatase PAP2 family protein [Bradyrhizobium jicamae]
MLPHILKTIFDQERPDRLTIRGHLHGVPRSGNKMDAFPSGHAIHVSAPASAASRLPAPLRNLIWPAGAALVATSIVLPAHWVRCRLRARDRGRARTADAAPHELRTNLKRWLTRQ